MKITRKLLESMGGSKSNAAEYVDDLQALLAKYGITDSKTRLAHFWSQVLHESGMMRYDTENLNYSAKALRVVFDKYFKTQDEADAYARKKKTANRMYANRMGNGDYAVASAVFCWDRNKLNAVADQDDIKVLTGRINGGYNGLEHRRDLYAGAAGLLA